MPCLDLFEHTFNQAAVGMSHVSLKGEWLRVNKKLCDIVGYSKEELLKKTFQEITHPEDLGRDLESLEKILRNEIQTYSIEKRYLRKDKSFVWINLTVSLFKDSAGKPQFFISVIENIHEKKIAEQNLKRLNLEMEKILQKKSADLDAEIIQKKLAIKDRNSFFDLSNDLMAIFSYSGSLKIANPALIRKLGYSEAELMSRRFIEFLHPEDLQITLEVRAKFRETGVLPVIENRYICKDGSVVLLSWAASGVPEDDCIYAIARDITEVRKQEIEMAEQKLKIATNAKLKALGRMASGIAHEINNPLTVVYGKANILKNILAEDGFDKEKIVGISDSINKMCERIIKIINGFSRFSRDATNDPFEFCSINQIIMDTLEFCQGRTLTYGINLKIDEIPDSLEFYCKPVQISQVLLNLINNAIDSVKKVEHKDIRISLVNSDSGIGLAVTDSGPVISKEQKENLFVPFFTTKEVGRGTGLGLSISKGIIDDHQGHIYLDQDCHQTSFAFLLPKVTR